MYNPDQDNRNELYGAPQANRTNDADNTKWSDAREFWGVPVQPQADRQPAAEEAPAPKQEFTAGSPAWSEASYKEANEKPEGYSPSFPGTVQQSQRSRRTSERKEKKKSGGASRFVRAVCLVLVCILASGVTSFAVFKALDANTEPPVNQIVIGSAGTDVSEKNDTDSGTAANLTTSGSAMSATDLYAMACDQVVGINTQVTTNVFGQTSSSAVSGSGFIISEDGYILTNYHVIKYAAEYGYDLTVILHDGTKHQAQIIGHEAENDVAVIKIDAQGLSAVKLGTSSEMGVGDTVYAVGNPLGELAYSMTSGIVSALDRVITTSESTSINMFQIDAAVNSGNSGGPVYNAEGEVIGIVTAKYSKSGVEGLGFAIPIDDVLDDISDLLVNGYVTGKAYLGVTLVDVTSTVAQYYNMVEGAYINSVVAGSCAEKAGLQIGDIIIGLNGTSITTTEELKTALKTFSAGETTTITIFRAGTEMEMTVTFDEKAPADETPAAEQAPARFPN